VRAKLVELDRQDPSAEMQFSMPDQCRGILFIALCRRYGLKPYRYHRQRRTTVMVRAPRRFINRCLWREFAISMPICSVSSRSDAEGHPRGGSAPTRVTRRRSPRRCRQLDRLYAADPARAGGVPIAGVGTAG